MLRRSCSLTLPVSCRSKNVHDKRTLRGSSAVQPGGRSWNHRERERLRHITWDSHLDTIRVDSHVVFRRLIVWCHAALSVSSSSLNLTLFHIIQWSLSWLSLVLRWNPICVSLLISLFNSPLYSISCFLFRELLFSFFCLVLLQRRTTLWDCTLNWSHENAFLI